MFKRKALTIAAAGVAALGLATSGTGLASAATPATFPNSGYGFDGNANLIVGGGSTTLFKMAQSLATLWEDTASCVTNNSVYNATSGSPTTYPQSAPAFNQCSNDPQSYSGTAAGGNFDGDTVAIATSAGSSTGIASLNGSHSGNSATYAYEGTNASIPTTGDPNAQNGLSNGYGTVDFALSSRAPKTSGGNCALANPSSQAAGDELQCDTFWGAASDGVDVFTFDSSVGAYDSGATNSGGTGGFSAQDLFGIFNCTITTWGQLPEWQAVSSAYASANSGATDPNIPASAAPIVPWGMNSTSGTLSDFDSYIANNASGVPSGWTVNNSCERELTTNGGNPKSLPLENDVKPIITEAQNNPFTPGTYPAGTASPYPSGTTYPAGVVGGQSTSPQNPLNWIWFGSYGLLTQFPYLSSGTTDTVTFNTGAVPLASSQDSTNGLLPTSLDIGNDTYPIERILSIVTKKADADCPLTSGVCNFTTNTGPTNGNGVADLDVLGASSGKGGAVREFIRFLCRKGSTDQPTDPYTGVNLSTEITAAIGGSGFSSIPVGLRSSGSACDVLSNG